MINISYILFFITDLPNNYNEFHETAVSVMQQLLLHTWNSRILVKVKGLTLIFFTVMTISRTGLFVWKVFRLSPWLLPKIHEFQGCNKKSSSYLWPNSISAKRNADTKKETSGNVQPQEKSNWHFIFFRWLSWWQHNFRVRILLTH